MSTVPVVGLKPHWDPGRASSAMGKRRHARTRALKDLPSYRKQGYTSIGSTVYIIAFLENGDNQSISKIAGNYFLVPDSRKENMQFLNESWASSLVYFGRDTIRASSFAFESVRGKFVIASLFTEGLIQQLTEMFFPSLANASQVLACNRPNTEG